MVKAPVQTRRTVWRKTKSDLMMGVTVLATVITLLPLFIILAYLFAKGASSLNLAFFTHMPAPVGEKGGGMANAIVGTLELIGLASLFVAMARPVVVSDQPTTGVSGPIRKISTRRFRCRSPGAPFIATG